MNNSTWHTVGEQEKKDIKNKSKVLLEKFSNKLSAIDCKEGHFSSSTYQEGLREEGDCWQTDEKFRDLTLLNAPFIEDDFITAEKASWNK